MGGLKGLRAQGLGFRVLGGLKGLRLLEFKALTPLGPGVCRGWGLVGCGRKQNRGRREVAHAGHADKIVGEVQCLVESRGHSFMFAP